MALSRMIKLGEICNIRNGSFLQRPVQSNNFIKNVRSFKRNQRTGETKPNLENVASPFHNVCVNTSSLTYSRLLKPLGFTAGFSAVCFASAAIWQYENMRSHAITMMREPYTFMKRKGAQARQRTDELTKEFLNWWNGLTPGEKIFTPICIINVLVFCAWRIPSLQPTMLKYFCSNPGGKIICWPMLLSTFSHYSAFHLLANMYVLHSFSTGAVASLGKEQFLALYLSAGVFSSFTSYVYKTVAKQSGLSLGASGAIMAILGYVCTQFPDTKLGIIFLPFLTFSAGDAIKVIVALDTAGVVFGWKFFDHAAHLGGAALGIAWALWGNEKVWQKRDYILQYWHQFRGAIK